MNTAKLPARLHQFYSLEDFPSEGLPQQDEEDYHLLNRIADRVLIKMEAVRLTIFELFPLFKYFIKDYTKKIFPAQVVVAINSLPNYNSRACPFWSCPSGSSFDSYSGLLSHINDAHIDVYLYTVKLSKKFRLGCNIILTLL